MTSRPLAAALAALAAIPGCGHRPPAPAPRPTEPPAPENIGSGELRGIRFATPPIVTVRVCRGSRRECFPVTYAIFARLNRRIAQPHSRIAEVEFDVGDA